MTTTMFTRCLFCHGQFEENGQLAHLPRGRRIAFDPVEGRLWAVCARCHRWNLAPIEEREAALYELERLVRDHARPLGHTANALLRRIDGYWDQGLGEEWTAIRPPAPRPWRRSPTPGGRPMASRSTSPARPRWRPRSRKPSTPSARCSGSER